MIPPMGELRRFLEGRPVATMRGDEVPMFHRLRELADWVGAYFEDRCGSLAVHPALSEIVIDRRSAKSSISHGMTQVKGQAFYLVPDIIAHGRILFSSGIPRQIEGFILGAPVRVGDSSYVAVAVIRQDANCRRFYLHEAIELKKLRTSSKTGAPTEVVERTGADAGAIRTILADIFSVNPDARES